MLVLTIIVNSHLSLTNEIAGNWNHTPDYLSFTLRVTSSVCERAWWWLLHLPFSPCTVDGTCNPEGMPQHSSTDIELYDPEAQAALHRDRVWEVTSLSNSACLWPWCSFYSTPQPHAEHLLSITDTSIFLLSKAVKGQINRILAGDIKVAFSTPESITSARRYEDHNCSGCKWGSLALSSGACVCVCTGLLYLETSTMDRRFVKTFRMTKLVM